MSGEGVFSYLLSGNDNLREERKEKRTEKERSHLSVTSSFSGAGDEARLHFHFR